VAAYKTEQRHLVYRGLDCHFVSYEGQPANPKKSLAATPATWYFMKAGKRFPVMEQLPGQTDAEIDRLLLEWLEEQGFAPAPVPVAPVYAGRR
jgi:hypothetical protein